MCDTSNTLSSSTLSSTVSLIPNNIFPYLSLGLVFAGFMIYTLHCYCPSARLGRLNGMITAAEAMLDHAKANCRRDYLALSETNIRVLRLYTRLLDARHFLGWKDYVQTMMAISLSLPTLRREVRDAHTSLLILIEASRQRRITEDINESQEAMNGTQNSGMGIFNDLFISA
ncbi:hypothetical protein K438DRAFT_1756746 [Mycena galopus ATCC 62051]|nr:hypothetical protein K438DRAFT_1756746 [Mycena galopus ATCC 62051]